MPCRPYTNFHHSIFLLLLFFIWFSCAFFPGAPFFVFDSEFLGGPSEAPFVVLWMSSTDIVAILSAHVGTNTNNGVLFAQACRAKHNRWIGRRGGVSFRGLWKRGRGHGPTRPPPCRLGKTWHLDTISSVCVSAFVWFFVQLFFCWWLSTFIVLRSAYYIWSFHVLPISFLNFFRYPNSRFYLLQLFWPFLGLLVIRNEMFGNYVSSTQKQKSFANRYELKASLHWNFFNIYFWLNFEMGLEWFRGINQKRRQMMNHIDFDELSMMISLAGRLTTLNIIIIRLYLWSSRLFRHSWQAILIEDLIISMQFCGFLSRGDNQLFANLFSIRNYIWNDIWICKYMCMVFDILAV